ncbi:MAG: extracellular solute-binding protein [Clostridia bacterium]|nr:extracellular solute-binding protein [Clostridia bacterium]
MERTKFHRLCALLLALLFLIPGGVIVTSATETATGADSSVTDKTIADVREQLNAISYDEYSDKYSSVKRAESEIVINGTNYNKEATNAEVSVGTYDGVEALYTPGSGTVAWNVKIDETAKYSLILEVYPNEGKATSIQRILRIDGSIPFAEARYITIPKVWKSEYVDGEVLVGKNESADTYLSAAAAVGMEAYTETRDDGTYVLYKFPDTWTEDIANYVDENTIRFFRIDIDDNEIRNSMVQAPEWKVFELKDADGFYSESFEFVLAAGEHTISLEAVNEPVTIKSIKLVPHEDLQSYDDYSSQYAGESKGSSVLKIEAEFPSASTTQTVYPVEDRTCAINSPTSTQMTLLNTIGGDKWQTSGQAIEYRFVLDNPGMYNIVTRFRQNILDGIYTSRSLSIYSEGLNEGDKGYYNGVPFSEATELVFNYSTDWQSGALQYLTKTEDADGNITTEYHDIELYFAAGVEYTIRFEVSLGSMGPVIRRLTEALEAINNDYLDILQLTGANPDKYRDYGFYRIMPDTIIDLKRQADILEEVANEMAATAGVKSTNSATLIKLVTLLRRMHGDEDEIARNLDQLKSYLGTFGTLLSDTKTQPLQLDFIVIQSSDVALPKAKPNFFQSFGHEMSSFIQSFFRNYDRMGAITENVESDEVVDVWLATGRDQAQVVRNLINNDFTPVYNIPVNLQLVAGATLLPSILAGSGPDVYIGLGEDNVINYAIRGALREVEDLEGFYDLAVNEETRQFNEAAMLVLGIEDSEGDYHYYGLPENQSFPMMFIRTDILADLGLEIPKTWDDILEAVPILQSQNMEIGLSSDYKIFLYQMGGELFADDGMRINLDSNTALESFETMCNMFTMYSFPYKYDFENRFRTGEMPIGIASYIGTYNKLVVYATEIRGMWQFVPLPGIVDDEGNVNNVSVSTVSAIVMINSKDTNVDGGWEFMKWHSGAQCQSDYANEMAAILGDSAKHSTANLNALSSLPWTTEEYNNVALQFNNLASIPNYPGSYIIGRYTKFAFLDAYNDKADPTTELLSYITTINKEITKKRNEFGLETLEIGETKASKRMEQVTELVDNLKKSAGYNASYDAMVNSALSAMNSNEAAAMLLVSEQFNELYATLDANGTVAQNEIAKVREARKCASFEAYEYVEETATIVYYIGKYLADAGNALNSYVD